MAEQPKRTITELKPRQVQLGSLEQTPSPQPKQEMPDLAPPEPKKEESDTPKQVIADIRSKLLKNMNTLEGDITVDGTTYTLKALSKKDLINTGKYCQRVMDIKGKEWYEEGKDIMQLIFSSVNVDSESAFFMMIGLLKSVITKIDGAPILSTKDTEGIYSGEIAQKYSSADDFLEQFLMSPSVKIDTIFFEYNELLRREFKTLVELKNS